MFMRCYAIIFEKPLKFRWTDEKICMELSWQNILNFWANLITSNYKIIKNFRKQNLCP